MAIVIKIIAIIFTVLGVVCLIKPGVLKTLMGFCTKGKRLYLAGLIRFILAIVFFLSARECDIPWVIVVFGILFLAGGLSIFLIPLEKLKSIVRWWQERGAWLIRVLAVITIAVGAIILYSA